jgi:hypothetical protein
MGIGWIDWIGEDEWIGDDGGTPDPGDANFLLEQDGTVFLLESTGGLLLEP